MKLALVAGFKHEQNLGGESRKEQPQLAQAASSASSSRQGAIRRTNDAEHSSPGPEAKKITASNVADEGSIPAEKPLGQRELALGCPLLYVGNPGVDIVTQPLSGHPFE